MKIGEIVKRLGPYHPPETVGSLSYSDAHGRLTNYLTAKEEQLGHVRTQNYRGYYSDGNGLPFHAWTLEMGPKSIKYGAHVTPTSVYVELYDVDGFEQFIALARKIN